MKIAHFVLGRCNPDTANGVEKTISYLATNHASLGDEVAIFSISDKPPIPYDGVSVRTYSPTNIPFTLPAQLVGDLKAMSPDVIHIHSGYVPYNIAVGRIARRWKTPYVVTPNGNCAKQVLSRRPWIKLPYKHFLERPYLNKAAFIHAVGDGEDVRKYGITVPIVDAPNGMDVSLIPADLDRSIISKRFPQTRDKRVFLYLGRLDPTQKGLDLLIDAFGAARRESAEIVLVLVGPDWWNGKAVLEKQIARLGLYEDVIFWGSSYGKEKFDLLASCDVFVHTSRWEGLAFAVVEALACGKPSLLTKAADPCGELVAKYGAGIVVQPDVNDIKDAIINFQNLPDESLTSMSNQALDLVLKELNWVDISKKVRDGYLSYAVNK
jgi:glycosyltransferase involved in cell wall biosynthesis